MTTCAIGVSKKCCYLCDQLHKRLFNGDSCPMGCTASKFLMLYQGPVRVRLPNTHGRIFPWDPPPFGISPEVLKGLANDLSEHLLELAQREVPKRTSQLQSSPESSGDENEGELMDPEDLASIAESTRRKYDGANRR